MRPVHTFLALLSVALSCTITPIWSLVAIGKVHEVGGHEHWAPNVDYTVWSTHERFYRGDWLVFRFRKGMYDVVQVNETDYDRCSADHPILVWNGGNSYATQLNETGRYYYICSRGYCWEGMKVALVVENRPTPAPVPSPSSPASAPLRGTSAIVALILAVARALTNAGFALA
ncbi:hypothetical protein HPP92_008106 [Vanilla planifolia]|uniref:Phytocyanin domain-containing protein n=1 Tax=Vanilla planifolia TaxID=51239 RepID=A0A835V7L3_VANPL|nr:hypothetical protein HPP92_008106 [Vanilla planifolia]